MATWNNRELVFVHVPKTGGISMLRALRHHDITILGHDIRKPDFVSLADYKATHPDCYAFAFVRNPWDRVVSAFFYLSRGGMSQADQLDNERYLQGRDFGTFVREAFQNTDIFQQTHFRPQHQWLGDGKQLVVDAVAGFENLAYNFARYFMMFGLPPVLIPHDNQGEHEHFSTYYDRETWDIVGRAYASDVRLFQYPADYPPSPVQTSPARWLVSTDMQP